LSVSGISALRKLLKTWKGMKGQQGERLKPGRQCNVLGDRKHPMLSRRKIQGDLVVSLSIHVDHRNSVEVLSI